MNPNRFDAMSIGTSFAAPSMAFDHAQDIEEFE